MKRFVTAIVAISACMAAAQAAGYDEFARGVSAHIRDDHDTAIAALTAALNSGELVAAYKADALRIRAGDFVHIGRCDKAAADLDAYAALRPDDRLIGRRRIDIALCRGDVAAAQNAYDQAEKQFEAAHGRKPDYTARWAFGEKLWQVGQFEPAAANYLESLVQSAGSDAKPTRKLYIAIRYALNADRAGKLDPVKLADATKDFDLTEWPGPFVALFLGKLSADDVLNLAFVAKSDVREVRQCEANYFVAAWYLAHNNKAAALPLLQAVVDGCAGKFGAYDEAEFELKRQSPAKAKE